MLLLSHAVTAGENLIAVSQLKLDLISILSLRLH